MTDPSICPKCGKPLPGGAPQGLCPDCLMQGAFPTGADSSPGEASPRKSPRFVPPSLDSLAPLFPSLEILEFIGQGGMGAVYKARQKELDRIVALKILPPETSAAPGFAERFALEAKALARLNHPNIVTLFEFGRANGLFFFLMELVDGVSLRQLLSAGRMSAREALAIVPQICDALQFAHDQGIVHRDIKPENILLDRRGRVKVADFGLAKLVKQDSALRDDREDGGVGAALTEAGRVMGTPRYMAPEQMIHPGEVDHRADIYALGVVFYQMLTGELPGKEVAWPLRKVQIDVRLNEIVLRTLEKQPERRYQQASEVKTALESLHTPPPGAETPVPAAESVLPVDAPPALLGVGNALMIIGAAGLLGSRLVQLRGFSSDSLDVSLGAFGYWRIPMPALASSLAMAWMHWSQVFNLAVLVGGWKIRRLDPYPFGILGAILALVALPLQPIGFLVGAWALVVLGRDTSRAAFATAAAARVSATIPARLSWMAVAAAVTVMMPVLWDCLMSVWAVFDSPQPITESRFGQLLMSSLLLTLYGWAPIISTFLGWVAFEDIRKARGALKGTALATLALTFVPVHLLAGWMLPWERSGESTPPELMVVGLVRAILTLAVSAGFALLVQWQERRSLRHRVSGSSAGWWLMSRGALWAIRLLVCGLALAQIGTSTAARVQMSAAHPALPSQALMDVQSHGHQHLLAGEDTDPSRFVADLPYGQVALVALTDITTPALNCWRPNGEVLCPGAPRTRKARPVVLETRLPSDSEISILPFRLNVDGRELQSMTSFTRGDRPQPHGFICFSAEPDARSLTLRLVKPIEDWQDTDAGWEWNGKMPRHPRRYILREGQQFKVNLEYVTVSPDGTCQVTWTTRGMPDTWIGRVIVVDQSGAVLQPKTSIPAFRDLGVTNYVESFQFNLPLAELKQLRFQLRRGAWVDVRSISLQPGVMTTVEVVDSAPPGPPRSLKEN